MTPELTITSLTIDSVDDVECERCHEPTENGVSISVETSAGVASVFLCGDCIADAVTAAVDDGLLTEMIVAK